MDDTLRQDGLARDTLGATLSESPIQFHQAVDGKTLSIILVFARPYHSKEFNSKRLPMSIFDFRDVFDVARV